jgi:hypothetical protein
MNIHTTLFLLTTLFSNSIAHCMMENIVTTYKKTKKYLPTIEIIPKEKENIYIQDAVWVKAHNSEQPIPLTKEEASHLSRIHIHHSLFKTGKYYDMPICLENIIENKVTKKDLLFFKNIFHKPLLFSKLSEKKYIKALHIASELECPLLYAELLYQRLPNHITASIAQNYMQLINFSEKLKKHLYNTVPKPLLFDNYIKLNNKLTLIFTNFLTTINLMQAILLGIMKMETDDHTARTMSKQEYIELIPHTPGHYTFMEWYTSKHHGPLLTYCKFHPHFITIENDSIVIKSFSIAV